MNNNEEIEVLDEEDLKQEVPKENNKKKVFPLIAILLINFILSFIISYVVVDYKECKCGTFSNHIMPYTESESGHFILPGGDNNTISHNYSNECKDPSNKSNLETYNTRVYLFVAIFILFNIIAFSINIQTKKKSKIIPNAIILFIFSALVLLILYEKDTECLKQLKPILYLYPEKEMNITVNFDKEELLTTTYPKFNKEWNVLVKPDGSIYEKGNYYYALYWEENRIKNCDFKDGFYVEKDDAIKFLEDKLTTLGLNDKERNEFIMYWLPKLEENDKSIVHFDLTDELQKENEMIINPKPDSILRIHINVKKVNKKTNIKEQKLPTFKRSGYTAIEWGGTIY